MNGNSESESSPFIDGQPIERIITAQEKQYPRKSSLHLGGQRSRFQVAKVDFAEVRESDDDADSDTGSRLVMSTEAIDGAVDIGDHRSPSDAQSPTQNSVNNSTYDTHNVKSLRHYTREPLPRAAHYRDIRSIHTHQDRPTLDDLHNPPITVVSPDSCKVSGGTIF